MLTSFTCLSLLTRSLLNITQETGINPDFAPTPVQFIFKNQYKYTNVKLFPKKGFFFSPYRYFTTELGNNTNVREGEGGLLHGGV